MFNQLRIIIIIFSLSLSPSNSIYLIIIKSKNSSHSKMKKTKLTQKLCLSLSLYILKVGFYYKHLITIINKKTKAPLTLLLVIEVKICSIQVENNNVKYHIIKQAF